MSWIHSFPPKIEKYVKLIKLLHSTKFRLPEGYNSCKNRKIKNKIKYSHQYVFVGFFFFFWRHHIFKKICRLCSKIHFHPFQANDHFQSPRKTVFYILKWHRKGTLLWNDLTLSWWRSLSNRNQSIDLQSKSMNWFLYDRDLRHEKVNIIFGTKVLTRIL